MLNSVYFDIAGPQALFASLGLGAVALIFGTLIIVFIEAAVLKLLKWGTFKRGLLAAFTMNLVTTLIGFCGIALLLVTSAPVLIVEFLLSVLIEGGILMLFKRGAARGNWLAALLANLASYLLIILPAYIFFIA